jgi:glycosyltransferase involved in cell wall biosynthesis
MKILFVTPSYYPATRFGGPIQSVHLLAKYLVSQNIDIKVITTNAGQENPKNFNSKDWTFKDGVKVKYFSFWGYEHFNFSIPLFFHLLFSIKKYDIVHITAVWNFPVWAASFVCTLFNKPYIISPRGTLYPETIALGSTKFKKIYYRFIAQHSLRNASYIHYTTQDEKQSVEKYLNLKTKGIVIPNGIDTTFFDKNIDDQNVKSYISKPYILFLGRIHPKKGLDILLEAFSKLIAYHKSIQLVLAGPDDINYKAELNILAEKYFIKDKIIFTGELKGNSKLIAYKNAKFFVLSSYSENFGMAVVEAMLMNCPVIVSNKVGIAAELETKQGVIVCKPETEDLYHKMKKLLENPDLRKELADKSASVVKELYDINNVGIQYLNLYKSLLKV